MSDPFLAEIRIFPFNFAPKGWAFCNGQLMPISQNTARQLVLYHRRSGGQSQFSSLLELKTPNGRFGPLLAWARENLDAPLTVEDLADKAGMSSRHFTRAFIAETGTTPSKAVERLRIEVARQRVQSSGEAIERVAEITGFRDPERMRRAFIRAFGDRKSVV